MCKHCWHFGNLALIIMSEEIVYAINFQHCAAMETSKMLPCIQCMEKINHQPKRNVSIIPHSNLQGDVGAFNRQIKGKGEHVG